jgi:hypothetical protein
LSSTFRQVSFGQGLQAPGDAFDQPGAVAGVGCFAKEFGEALPQLADARSLDRRDLVDKVQFHRVFSCCWLRNRLTPVENEPEFAEKIKSLRDKKERFFESRKGAG